MIVTIVDLNCVNHSSYTLLLYTIRCGDQFDSRQGKKVFCFPQHPDQRWETWSCRGEAGGFLGRRAAGPWI